MPNTYIHTIYKEYINTQLDEKLKEASESEAIHDELIDAMT